MKIRQVPINGINGGKMKKALHFGNWLQIMWIGVGIILQIWIGGIKGFVVLVVGSIMFFINSNIITKLTKGKLTY